MTTRRSVRKARASKHLRGQALGFVVMAVALGSAFAGSRAYEEIVEGPPPVASGTDEAQEITTHIEDAAARYGVDPRLVAAIIAVESEFDPYAVSRRGAEGLMQLMPRTAASYDVQDSFDVRDNIEGGVRHLRRLMDRFRNDIPLVLAAYNAGEQAVFVYHGIPPYRETRRYVVRVLVRYDPDAARAVARRFRSPATAKPAFARATRAVFVAPVVSVPAVDAAARSLSVPAVDTDARWRARPAEVSSSTRVSGWSARGSMAAGGAP